MQNYYDAIMMHIDAIHNCYRCVNYYEYVNFCKNIML
jgi:hypothetical protein